MGSPQHHPSSHRDGRGQPSYHITYGSSITSLARHHWLCRRSQLYFRNTFTVRAHKAGSHARSPSSTLDTIGGCKFPSLPNWLGADLQGLQKDGWRSVVGRSEPLGPWTLRMTGLLSAHACQAPAAPRFYWPEPSQMWVKEDVHLQARVLPSTLDAFSALPVRLFRAHLPRPHIALTSARRPQSNKYSRGTSVDSKTMSPYPRQWSGELP
ncbi:hypothetical protein CONLIGDRAFT_518120 [Coniochaeta ligniaria NRRL 30616]|uniref:Uncharacterized protein n=1 Tax=Coniochaeta ligniaria NRRL 30616 TaxID=1408157 RepID=A0A1J7JA76_9PEZI|nr:hypothetical protein CONLIGDRAFT_518120 [Coniochaeta ligniaria NRRL 30616]